MADGRVLWVTEEPPDRSLGGGNIRQAHLFEALARTTATDLLVVGRLADESVRAAAASVTELPETHAPRTEHPIGRRARELATSLTSPYPLSMASARPARRALADAIAASGPHDLVCVEHEGLVPLAARAGDVPWVVTFHHLLSGMIEEQVALAPGRRQRWIRQRDLDKARRLEVRALDVFERVIVCSAEDSSRLAAGAGCVPGDRISVIPNGVDLELFDPTPLPPTPSVLLPGTLDWPPNVDGARWFCAEIWPRVREAIPDATLVLAGRSPVAEVRTLAQLDGVSVDGDVPSMVPYFERARAIAVPLRVGTGTRLKALEGMAAARPVIGTTIGLGGIAVADRQQALIADRPDEFAAAIVDVLEDDALARRLAAAGRGHVEANFGWDRIGEQFVELIAGLVDRPQAAARSSKSAA